MVDQDALSSKAEGQSQFNVENNPFAFSPTQLSKLINPKSYSALLALGGLSGLEKGLRTDIRAGLSVDEERLTGFISFEEAKGAASGGMSSNEKSQPGPQRTSTVRIYHETKQSAFVDRKRVFGDNRLPERKSKSIWRLAWIALQDKLLILLSIAAVISLALGLYQTFRQTHNEGAKVEWVEGVAIIVTVLIIVIVGTLNDWQKERQFVKLNRKKEDRFVKVIRSGKTMKVSIYNVFVGDVMVLEQGDILASDGIYINGHNVSCDESSATGESDLIKKTPAEEALRALQDQQSLKKLDSFIIAGTKVSEGVGSFLVTAVGVNSSYGKTMVSLHDDNEMTPLQFKLNVIASKWHTFTIQC